MAEKRSKAVKKNPSSASKKADIKTNSSEVSKDEIAEIASKLIFIPKEEILNAASLKELGIQSLDVVELICELEDRYKIELNLEGDMDWLMSLDQAVEYLQKKIDEKEKK